MQPMDLEPKKAKKRKHKEDRPSKNPKKRKHLHRAEASPATDLSDPDPKQRRISASGPKIKLSPRKYVISSEDDEEEEEEEEHDN